MEVLYTPITIDLITPNPLPVLKAKQGDTARGALITLMAGAALTLTDETVRVFIKKPDGHIVYADCEIENGKVKAAYSYQMVAAAGKAELEIEIDDGIRRLSTPIAILQVMPSNISEDAIESTDEMSALQTMIRNAEAATNNANEAAENVKDGVSPTIEVTEITSGHRITITDAEGTKTVDVMDSQDYILTDADKAEIAETVEGCTIVQAPKYVDSVDDMTDTSRVYVLASTGEIWAYMDTTTEQEVTVTDEIIGTTDNPYQTGRLSSGGALSNDVQTHTLTPYIDLTKAEYQGKTIQIHLDGNRYVTENSETYIMSAQFDSAKSALMARGYSMQASGGAFDTFDGETVVINDTTSATLTIPIPLTHKGTGKTIAYMRFCGLGTVTDSVYITYTDTQTVSGGQWVSTGTTYAPALTDEDKQAMVDEIVAMIDADLLSVVGGGTVTV